MGAPAAGVGARAAADEALAGGAVALGGARARSPEGFASACTSGGGAVLLALNAAGGEVVRFDRDVSAGETRMTRWKVPGGERAGCIVPRAKGGVLLGLAGGGIVSAALPEGGGEAVLDEVQVCDVLGDVSGQDPEKLQAAKVRRAGLELCAARADSAGRLWVGSRPRCDPGASAGGAELFCVEGAWRMRQGELTPTAVSNVVHEVGNDLLCDHGVAWSPCGATMYFVDAASAEVCAFPHDARTGVLGERRVVARVTGEGEAPRGLAVDVNGGIWTAVHGGSRVVCLDAESGEVRKEVALPAKRPTGVCFGGEGMAWLFVTTEKASGGDDDAGGAMLALEVGAVGTAVNACQLG